MTAAPDGLPPLAALDNACLDWRNDASGEAAPHSSAFDDVYFSRHDGRAETEHVFVAGNRLTERFREWQEPRPFVIGETGFGTGLNMLCAWACFDAHAAPEARLHLVSTEKFPLDRADLARALAAWPDLARRSESLVAQWPEPVTGVHRLWLDERVTLDLHLGDAAERLSLLDGRVDAWFLDGFAPAKNPEMWQPALFQAMAARSRPGATFATFSCAGVVKRGLAAAGFTWHKSPGFGRKREMLYGEIAEPPLDERRRQTPWFTPPAPRPPRHVAIIGAGIAGASAAAALARRGIAVTLIDRLERADLEATHLQGALYVKLAADTNRQSRIYLAGLLHSRRWLAWLDPRQSLWRKSGVLQLALNDKEQARQTRFLANHPLPESVVRGVDAAGASAAAGVRVDAPALDYPNAAWVRPMELCIRLAETSGVSFLRGEVTALRRLETGWRLEMRDGEPIEADQVIVAGAAETVAFEQTTPLPLQPVRGQLSQLELPSGAPRLGRVVCAGGYVPPAADGVLNIGATFAPDDTDTTPREGDHRANLEELERGLPHFVAALRDAGTDLSPERLRALVGVRAASPDKTPYCGPVPDADAWREEYAVLAKDATRIPEALGRHHAGLWISTAHGSRGLASAPLCAELLASRICDEPLPLEQPLADHLHPGRRLIRDLIRGK
ncbi:bifunctional tRNA (5-methylaminomethyl-2-thiouridine)(34)-methyltransferase MnmD/FAD-dependent 5-carboxymethylaminomethyl-2-thiouridine(34) oxidoreductase MnmC [Halomonas icarae]|uniref:tRNA 5-methylaminomethyl-2-thiouridine biosynthesis bifunctional protein MnmC n=1 Tax=Halomonas icarae TaxID=2691040 RepID=A0A7X4W0P6_9GAMM|nr:bifunctional tRNA (5-methylaminomethyl-2-thiouridine)(34)-methyltransferase MnmD/FAD-dependent 5-carboxymethylaminomethyl-2-thiouridine(34) oxidoreductase MnmC [Halomonas icarae]MDR5900771.1 bifunctional tRNA (5-methylaminomethyl-2-thiouridine)(34)-methyltransferase MnmD/FAD-dependent 5-carboxymethylaminomethyl-2-thiouridine(34) oxidoreductase MnmC [Halomonas icarae]NAW13761.1 bifunctional tRNA (5-methylaminomethyl-2-thiouridine)(34)-methyltransferase MnmD/FAD-dependent 5-carboxymethylaminomet